MIENFSHPRLQQVKRKNSTKRKFSFSPSDVESDTDDEEPLPVDDYYFVQPIATRQRRNLLRQAGLMKIDTTEKQELNLIRRSREICGCSCTRELGGCQPLTCECYSNGIACQVDRLTFPCPCATMPCLNPLGRLEFNQNRVRNHFFQTITRLKAEKQQEELSKNETQHIRFIFNLVFVLGFSSDESVIRSILSTILSVIECEENQIVSLLTSMIESVEQTLIDKNDSSPTIGDCSITEIENYPPIQIDFCRSTIEQLPI